jgi:hypothetical protein
MLTYNGTVVQLSCDKGNHAYSHFSVPIFPALHARNFIRAYYVFMPKEIAVKRKIGLVMLSSMAVGSFTTTTTTTTTTLVCPLHFLGREDSQLVPSKLL